MKWKRFCTKWELVHQYLYKLCHLYLDTQDELSHVVLEFCNSLQEQWANDSPLGRISKKDLSSLKKEIGRSLNSISRLIPLDSFLYVVNPATSYGMRRALIYLKFYYFLHGIHYKVICKDPTFSTWEILIYFIAELHKLLHLMVISKIDQIPAVLHQFRIQCVQIISGCFLILQRQMVEIFYEMGPLMFTKYVRNGTSIKMENVILEYPNQRFDNRIHNYLEVHRMANTVAPPRDFQMKNRYLNGRKIYQVRYLRFPWGQLVQYKFRN